MSAPVNTLVVGGTGYVAGELLRLIAGHPGLSLAAVASESRAGTPVGAVFPHLQGAADGNFVTTDALREHMTGRVALFSAAPHGASAPLIAGLAAAAAASGAELTTVDVSADFRFADPARYAEVYGAPHPAPALLEQFVCALPEHLTDTPSGHVAHPGCFATALLLAIVPIVQEGLAAATFFASGVTGSTGSGRAPRETTHHPVRHANLFAYKPLVHRHAPEVVAIAGRMTGVTAELHFVPHSGPFARGIHATVQAPLQRNTTADAVRDAFSRFYSGAPFVRIVDGMPRLKDVVGSNYAHLGVAVDAGALCVTVAIDNLLKGAAGGAVQWMNRCLGINQTAGLTQPGPGWL